MYWIAAVISMVFTKLFLENALAIRPCTCEAASEPLLSKVARCIPVLLSRYTGKCAAHVLKRSGSTDQSHDQYGGGCAVQKSVCTLNQSHHRYERDTSSVRRGPPSVRRHTFSKEEGVHYMSVTPSAWWRVCITYLSHHHYWRGCALHIGQNIYIQDQGLWKTITVSHCSPKLYNIC